LLSVERQIGNVKEIKIPTHHSRVTGIQKSIRFRYVCMKCNFSEEFDSSQQTWQCKCED